MGHLMPSVTECRLLLRSVAAGPGLLGHLELVARTAGELAVLCRIDKAECLACALLHDVGRAPLAVELAASLTGRPRPVLAAMDHAELGAFLLEAAGDPLRQLAGVVGRHALGSVLGPAPPVSPVEQVVFTADKLVGRTWLGFSGRMRDLERRYGHEYDIRLCIPGAETILRQLAGMACLSTRQLEALVAGAVTGAVTIKPFTAL
ncbi:MAG: HD domain-containing protein [Bacillota bacterium]|nr:HD domain-containing protein [Bacillota bacterium]